MTTTNPANVKFEKKSAILGEFKVQVEAKLMRDRMSDAFNSLQKRVTLPGFRAGKVPMDIVRKKYHEDVLHDVFQKVVWETYRGAAIDQKIPAVGDPRILNTNLNDWEDGKSLEYTAEFDLLPEVSLKKYKGLPITEHSTKIKEEDVDIVVKGLLDPRAELINLDADTRVARGHFVVMDFAGSLEGEELPDATAKNFFMEVGGKNSLESFQDGVIGMKAGQSKTINVDYPKDFSNAKIAGKTINYAVTIHEVKEKRYPEVTDELAKDFQANSKEEFYDRIRKSLEEELKAEKEQHQREEIIVALIESNPFEVPQTLVQRQLQYIVQDLSEMLKRQRYSDNLIQEYLAKHWKELHSRAEKEVKLALLMPKLEEAEKITASENEVLEHIRQGAAAAGNTNVEALEKQLLSSPERKADMEREVRRHKAIRLLIENAKLTKAK